MNEQYPEPTESSEVLSKNELDGLPDELGFIETTSLLEIKQKLLEAFARDDTRQVPYLSDLYQAAGREAVEKIADDSSQSYIKAQIGFIIARANMYWTAGKFGLYRSELNDALTYAENMDYDDIAGRLQAARDNIPHTEENQLDTEVTSSELALALTGTLSPEICEVISGMDLDDGLGMAFEELLEAGVEDPESFLIEKGILQ
jgi:hypothetical protein